MLNESWNCLYQQLPRNIDNMQHLILATMIISCPAKQFLVSFFHIYHHWDFNLNANKSFCKVTFSRSKRPAVKKGALAFRPQVPLGFFIQNLFLSLAPVSIEDKEQANGDFGDFGYRHHNQMYRIADDYSPEANGSCDPRIYNCDFEPGAYPASRIFIIKC